jgi:UDP-N-acetylglucosamine 4,6-dehydratase
MFLKTPDYALNLLGERGRPVVPDFEYNSGTNERFLTVEEIRDLIQEHVPHG